MWLQIEFSSIRKSTTNYNESAKEYRINTSFLVTDFPVTDLDKKIDTKRKEKREEKELTYKMMNKIEMNFWIQFFEFNFILIYELPFAFIFLSYLSCMMGKSMTVRKKVIYLMLIFDALLRFHCSLYLTLLTEEDSNSKSKYVCS